MFYLRLISLVILIGGSAWLPAQTTLEVLGDFELPTFPGSYVQDGLSPTPEGWSSFTLVSPNYSFARIMPSGQQACGGLPTSGGQWMEVTNYRHQPGASVLSTGPASPAVPPGTPATTANGLYPFSINTVGEVRKIATVPTTVSGQVSIELDWKFLSMESPGGGGAGNNDFAQILIRGPQQAFGPPPVEVVVLYVDTYLPNIGVTNLTCQAGFPTFFPIPPRSYNPSGTSGAESVSVPIPSSLHGQQVTISIVVGDQGQTSGFASQSYLWVDNIRFVDPGGGSGSGLSLVVTQNGGPGALELQNLGGTPGSEYFTGFTLNQGSFPQGWFGGIDISLPEIVQQFGLGVPFQGTFNSIGTSFFVFPPGTVPAGLTIYAVTTELAPNLFSLAFSLPISITTI